MPLWFLPQRQAIRQTDLSSIFSDRNHQDNPELLYPVDFTNIRALTSKIHDKISSGTFDSPSWDLIRTAKLAARMYAPLGTMMTLGDHVRLIRIFIEAFKSLQEPPSSEDEELRVLKTDLKVIRHCPYYHRVTNRIN